MIGVEANADDLETQLLHRCNRPVEKSKHAFLDPNIQPESEHCHMTAVPRKHQLARSMTRLPNSVANDKSVVEEPDIDQSQKT